MARAPYHNKRLAADTISRFSSLLRISGICNNADKTLKRDVAAALIACIVPGKDLTGVRVDGCRTRGGTSWVWPLVDVHLRQVVFLWDKGLIIGGGGCWGHCH